MAGVLESHIPRVAKIIVLITRKTGDMGFWAWLRVGHGRYSTLATLQHDI